MREEDDPREWSSQPKAELWEGGGKKKSGAGANEASESTDDLLVKVGVTGEFQSDELVDRCETWWEGVEVVVGSMGILDGPAFEDDKDDDGGEWKMPKS